MKIPEIPLAQSILQIFKAYQITNIVISPGSRNAPLTLGFAHDNFFNCYSIVDERCAAFFALGIAQQTKKPVAVLCTSGSAILNYYPAIAEAFYSEIPLIVLSADRPFYKIDIGDGQTIRQENVLENHTVFNANLGDKASVKNDKLIQEAIVQSTNKKAPVHINVPFEEPLYNLTEQYSYTPKITKPKSVTKNFKLDESFIKSWKKATKKLIIVGMLTPNCLSDETIQLIANDPSVLVLTEITSNIHHPNFIPHIDTLITSFNEDEVKEFEPEIVLSLGGLIVSKRIKSLLRSYKDFSHWHIGKNKANDTYHQLKQHFKVNPDDFFAKLDTPINNKEFNYQKNFNHKLQTKLNKHPEYLAQTQFCDLKVFDILSKKLPTNIHLQISNSSAIRYALLFPFLQIGSVYCNRGTSGIDGSTATAIGAALKSDKPTTLITGDISFFYDSNALWNKYIPNNFKIILLNNSGGGIFRILPGHQENEIFHEFFETKHNLNGIYLSEMYGLKYLTASNEQELNERIEELYEINNQACLLEITTPSEINSERLKSYFKEVN